ncbi:hypothetical protein ATE68_23600 [Sphingopyxis sp. H038]|nr:hypothetical protein ATE78_23540 [Sphingopyxis sp. H012]KTE29131.1 hypothetical protein ATE68_23600 [Sphingopyxis sp. H038]KTE31863.1 hypothetical protein ATE73_24550 [Sphingopyxis sp. H077]KTE58144.1 hypothetical protein ATE74_24500 [Sphingopyxis sp. H085]
MRRGVPARLLLEVATMDLVLMGGKGRLLVKAKRSRREISQRSRDEFILSLSETCNVSLSAERAGVALSTVYKIRQRDAAFAGAWQRGRDANLWTGWRRVLAAGAMPSPLRLGSELPSLAAPPASGR